MKAALPFAADDSSLGKGIVVNAEQTLATLKKYQSELEDIQKWFRSTGSGSVLDEDDRYRLKTIIPELMDLLRDNVPGSVSHVNMINAAYVTGTSNFRDDPSYGSVEDIRSVVAAVMTRIERNPDLFSQTAASISLLSHENDEIQAVNALEQIVLRFHAVAVQLRQRRADRNTLDVNDEYDVQDLLHALLRIHFADIRPEEWTPSYAGASARTDFLLPAISTVIETKKIRVGMTAKLLGEQLIIDIARYRKHPQCRRLVCFVYDPGGRIANSSGIENDLNSTDHGIAVKTFILPKHS